METLGYVGALVMGLSLGLIGGGGSILTVPILVYLFSVDAVLATAYSLFIVGCTSLIGSVSHILQGNVHWRTVFVFGLPSIISVFITRHFLLPLIPQQVFQIGEFTVTKSFLMLVLFALLMIFASYSMIRKDKNVSHKPNINSQTKYLTLLLQGLFIGCITGAVGAGGGFLIIPALIFLAKLSMKQAIGTSLFIIALNALIGFTGNIKSSESINWHFLMTFSVIAVIGILAGSIFSKRIPNEKLKPAFGYFVLLMGIFIITKEVFFHHI